MQPNVLQTDALVTVSCAEGDTGFIYDGMLETEVTEMETGAMPQIPVKIMMNIGNPQLAFDFSQLPNDGVGLARLEFIINNNIGIHPKAILDYPNVDDGVEESGRKRRPGPRHTRRPFTLKDWPKAWPQLPRRFSRKKVIVRLSDFKSNEYRKLIGGARYEPEEENPMLGFRGASRYMAPSLQGMLRAGM